MKKNITKRISMMDKLWITSSPIPKIKLGIIMVKYGKIEQKLLELQNILISKIHDDY